jgi:hypothetical protein
VYSTGHSVATHDHGIGKLSCGTSSIDDVQSVRIESLSIVQ